MAMVRKAMGSHCLCTLRVPALSHHVPNLLCLYQNAVSNDHCPSGILDSGSLIIISSDHKRVVCSFDRRSTSPSSIAIFDRRCAI